VLGQVRADHVDRHHQRLVAVQLHQELAVVLRTNYDFQNRVEFWRRGPLRGPS
jgi:hypothetical protein